MERGYTNQSYLVSTADERLVLRCGWPGKALGQALREEQVLDWLARHPLELGVPRVIPTASGESHLRVDERTIHLYSRVPGKVMYSWKERCSETHLVESMHGLSALHRVLRPLDAGAAVSPLAHFEQQLASLRAPESTESISATPPLRDLLEQHLAEFVSRARAIIARAHPEQPLQWCHGDFQLENLLFEGEQLVGLVDFDTVRALPVAMDAAFALFNLTRDGDWEEGFRWDRERWQRGAEAYGGPLGASLVDQEWHELFCLDQALLHLRAGLESVWELDEGIGFLSAFRGVMTA